MSAGVVPGSATTTNWWTGLTAGDMATKSITVRERGPRETEGMRPQQEVQNDPGLYVAFSQRKQFDSTPMGQWLRAALMKGPNDQPGALAAYDYKDTENWPVYSSTQDLRPGTIYWVPAAQGPYNYWGIAFGKSATAGQNTGGVVDIPGTTPGGLSGANPYVSVATPGMVAGAARRAKELTLLRNGDIWYTDNGIESGGPESPHTGIRAAGPGLWLPGFGRPSDYGLPEELLSVAPSDATPADAMTIDPQTGAPTVIIPASKAYRVVVGRAHEGDPAAIEALRGLDLDIPDRSLWGTLRGVF